MGANVLLWHYSLVNTYKCVFLKQLLSESFQQTIQKQMIIVQKEEIKTILYSKDLKCLVLFGSPICKRLHNLGEDKGLCFA